MRPGSIVSRGGEFFIVLASGNGTLAVAPLCTDRSPKRAGDVSIQLGVFGWMVALCEAARLDRGAFDYTEITAAPCDVARCQAATERCKREQALSTLDYKCAFAQAVPSFRSGGRKVGSHKSAV